MALPHHSRGVWQRLLPVVAVLFLLAGGPAPRLLAATRVPDNLARTLDDWVKPLAASGELSGNLIVACRDSILLERSWGLADREFGIPNGPETRFCVASITKPMTVILAIQLIQAGRLGLQDPLAKWIPDFPRGDEIRVEHLLRHRSGIPHRVTKAADEVAPMTAERMVEFARKAPLVFNPGDQSLYSSAGFSVLARVLELASGQSYGDLLRQQLLDPLGLNETGHVDSRQVVPRRAASYVHSDQGVVNAPLQDQSFLVGAGSVVMTARDLQRLIFADGSGRLGEGPRQSALRGGRIAWNGSTNGFRAFADFDTTTQISVVFAGNLHSGAVDQLRTAIWAILAGETPKPVVTPPAAAVPVPAELLKSFEGLYDIAGNPRLAVRATRNGLDVNGWSLVATSDTTFFSLRDYAPVTVVRGPNGRPTRLDWVYGGEVMACPRVGDLDESVQ